MELGPIFNDNFLGDVFLFYRMHNGDDCAHKAVCHEQHEIEELLVVSSTEKKKKK